MRGRCLPGTQRLQFNAKDRVGQGLINSPKPSFSIYNVRKLEMSLWLSCKLYSSPCFQCLFYPLLKLRLQSHR